MKREFHAPEKKLRVGVLGTMDMVRQRSLTILEQHPWFEVTVPATSPRSVSKTYKETVGDRWKLDILMPERYRKMVIHNVNEAEQVVHGMDLVFLTVDMMKEKIRATEDAYAKHETSVVSNSLAHRQTPDVPMVIPEVNPEHFEVIATQRKRLGTEKGLVAVRLNCPIRSYVPVFVAWKEFEPYEATVTTYQAISGTGKNFRDWPEMVGNIVPYIGDGEEKSEKEPPRIYGHIEGDHIEPATEPKISNQCIRVPVLNGRTTAVFVKFRKKPTKEQLFEKLAAFNGLPQGMRLPSTPQRPIHYMEEENRPQAAFDVDHRGGIGILIGRLYKDTIYDWKLVGLSHNALRDVADGAIECAEALTVLGYIVAK